MQIQWLYLSFISSLAYALWGIFNGLAANTKLCPFILLFYSSLGYFFIGILSLFLVKFNFSNYSLHGIIYAVMIGISTGLGGLLLLFSINKGGNTNVVIAITASYPLITLIINSSLLHNSINYKQTFGILLSVVSIILMTTK